MPFDRLMINNCNDSMKTLNCPLTFPAATTGTKGYIFLKAEWACNVISFNCKTDSGTATIVVKKNGTAITGLTAVSCTSTTLDTAITAVAIAIGDNITIEFSVVSSPVNLCAELILIRL